MHKFLNSKEVTIRNVIKSEFIDELNCIILYNPQEGGIFIYFQVLCILNKLFFPLKFELYRLIYSLTIKTKTS